MKFVFWAKAQVKRRKNLANSFAKGATVSFSKVTSEKQLLCWIVHGLLREP